MRGTARLATFIGLFALAGCTGASSPAPTQTTPASESASPARSGPPRGIVPWQDNSVPVDNARVAASATLTYYGGRVVTDMQVVQVLWGTGSYLSNVTSTATPSMATFYQQALNSNYTAWLDHDYNTVTPSPANGTTKTNQHIGRGSFVGQFSITPSVTSTTIDDSQIQSELAAQIAAGHLPAPTTDSAGNNNTYYAIFFPHGKTITQGGSSSCVAGGFCAYHGTVANAGGHEIYYGVHPDMQSGSGCDTGCGSGTPFGNYTSVASHEMVETITDCEVGLATANAPPLAWYDSTNGEIGDICNANQGSFVGSDGVTYTIQNEWSNSQGACISQISGITWGSGNDFSISASPSSGSVTAGGSTTSTIATATTSGSAQTVSLSVSGAPAGVTATLSPTSVTSGASSTLTIATTSSAAAGTYTLTVTGSAASGSHTTTYSLTIAAVVGNDFSISANPTSVSFTPGGSTTSTISTAITSGAAQTVTLALSGAPSGVTGSFSPTSITGSGSSTLTLASTTAAAPGTYTLTVTGTAPSGSHTATISLTISGTTTGGVVNGGFESGSSGWTVSGTTSIATSGCHGGTQCAMAGSTSPTNGDSSYAQTFTAPTGTTGLSVWYKETCPDTITYDWALATLKDNTTGTTANVIVKACATTAWTQATAAVTAGHSYTLTLTNHDDNYAGDATYTLFDDVTLTTTTVSTGITNGGFDSGKTGWTTAGTTSIATSGCHGGAQCALAGSTSPTNGDSSFVQTFTAPTGVSSLGVWYKETCPDTITYDWALATLKDNTTGTTATVIAKACTTNAWTHATSAVTPGHSYTLTLTNHDDNYPGDATYTLFDDVTLQ